MLGNQQQFLIEKVCAPSFPRNHFGNDMRIDWRNVGPRKHSQTDAISCWFNTEEIIFNSRAQSYHPLIWEECQHEINSCNRKYLHSWTHELNRYQLLWPTTENCVFSYILYLLTIQYPFRKSKSQGWIKFAFGQVCI